MYGDSRLIDLNRVFPCNIRSVQQHFSAVRLIYSCKKVEYSRLSRAVRTDQSVQSFFFNRNVKPVYRTETAK